MKNRTATDARACIAAFSATFFLSFAIVAMADGIPGPPAPSGASEWTDTGTTLHPTETGDDVSIGAITPVGGAKLSVDGDADQVQVQIQGAAGQTADLAVFEDSAGADLLVVPIGGGLDTNGLPVVLDADGDSRIEAGTDDQVDIETGGSSRVVVSNLGLSVASGSLIMGAREVLLDADLDTSVTADTDDRVDVRAGGVDVLRVDGTTASSVNGLDVKSAATGNAPSLAAQGSDTNIDLELTPKGTGEVTVSGVQAFKATYAANASDQTITSGTETDITSLTGLTLPTTTNVSGKTFLVVYVVQCDNDSASANVTTVRFYSGSTGDKGDTEKHITSLLLPADATFGFDQHFGMFQFSPDADTDTKFGLSATGGANFKVSGGSNVRSTIRVVEVP